MANKCEMGAPGSAHKLFYTAKHRHSDEEITTQTERLSFRGTLSEPDAYPQTADWHKD